MIPKSKQTQLTEVPESLVNQLTNTLNADKINESRSNTTQTPNIAEDNTISKDYSSQTSEKKVQLNVCLPQSVKTDWKLLFTASNLSITQGIIFAVEHLKQEIERGEVKLSVGGVIINK